MGAAAAEPVAVCSQPWPRIVGAVALLVIGVCGATLLISPRIKASTGSLSSHSNWALATALPVSSDFPSDWGYALTGRLERPVPSTSGTLSPPPPAGAAAANYAPEQCGILPQILDHPSTSLAAFVHVDRYAQLFVQDAPPADAASTGESHEHGPNARFAIWVVPDGTAQIANYLGWLNQCGNYHVTNHFLDGQVKNRREVVTTVESRSAPGADAAAVVTRKFTPTAGHDPASTYHVEYYAVRGVLLECTVYLEGAELDQAKQVAARTLQRLRSL